MMQKICDFLNPLLKKKMGAFRYNEFIIKYYWKDMIGKDLANKCLPIKVEKNTLFILSESSTLNHHLLTIQGQIIEKINNFNKTNFIKNLYFFNGNIKDFDLDQWKTKKQQTKNLQKKIEKIPLNQNILKNIEDLTKNVSNNALREKIKNVLLINKKYQEMLTQRGYKKCSSCELLVDNSVDNCIFCAQLKKNELKNTLKTIFLTVPYINLEECQKYVKCDKIFFSNVKNHIISDLSRQIKLNKYSQKDLLVYAMLTMGEKAINLTDIELEKIYEQVKNKP